MTRLINLPPEILLKVFSINNFIYIENDGDEVNYFTAQELRKAGHLISLVCKDLKDFGQSFVWYYLMIDGDDTDDTFRKHIMSCFNDRVSDDSSRLGKFVKILHIISKEELEEEDEFESFQVEDGTSNTDSIGKIHQDHNWAGIIIKSCLGLKKFLISGYLASPFYLPLIFEFLKYTQLRSIYMNGRYSSLSTRSAKFRITTEEIASLLKSQPFLEEIEIANTGTSPALQLSVSSESTSTLSSTTLSFSEWIPIFFSSVNSSLLTHLLLFLPTPTFYCLQEVYLPNLKSIYLEKGTSDSSAETIEFCHQVIALLPKFPLLQNLVIFASDNRIELGKVFIKLLNTIPPSVTSLRLDLCETNNLALVEFWKSNRCASLEELQVCNDDIRGRKNVVTEFKVKYPRAVKNIAESS